MPHLAKNICSTDQFCFLKEAFSSRSEATVVVCSWETDDSDPIHTVERLFYETRQSCGWTCRGLEGRFHMQWCLQRCLMIVPSYTANGISFWSFFFNLRVVRLQKRSGQGISPFLLSKEVYHQVKKELLKQHSALEGERKCWSLLWPCYTPVCNHL